jgi:hypothetical protein
VAGGAALYASSQSEPDKPARPAAEGGASDAAASTETAAHRAEAAAPSPSPLAALVGNWRSASGRDFAAALGNDDTIEFRIREASQHAHQGYEDGDVRFKLSAIPGSKNEFAVEDRLRPTPPPGLEYEPTSSRESCTGVWTAVKGKKLLAQLDTSGVLTVDFVQVRTSADRFKTSGKRVTGCVNLASVPAEPIESKLSRVP